MKINSPPARASRRRRSSILGIVGAGGIGFLLADRLRAHELREACLIIILAVLAVYAIAYLS